MTALGSPMEVDHAGQSVPAQPPLVERPRSTGLNPVTEATGAAIMSGVLSVRMNDDAIRLLGVLGGMAGIEPPGGMTAGLRERLASGIVRRAHVLTWADSQGHADGAPSFFPDLTGWECADSSFHLEDEVPVAVTLTEESEPRISSDDQRVLLSHGYGMASAGISPTWINTAWTRS